MESTSDVIVIGSGPGGLTTAALLAASGRKVTVLEHHDVAGGNCTVFRRKDYEFDVGLHYIGGCGPDGHLTRLLRMLGLEDRITFRALDPDGFDRILLPGGEFRVPADWEEYRRRLLERYPDQARAIEGVMSTLEEVARSARGEGDTAPLITWALRSVADLFDEYGLTGEAATLLDHWSGLYGSGPSETSVAMHAAIIGHYMDGAYYPEGGGQVIPARLVQMIEALGGEVLVRKRVERILVENGRAVGVQTGDGEQYRAPVVVSNADYKRTMLELVGEQHLDADTVRSVRDARMTLPLYVLYVVVEGDIGLEASHNYFVFGDEPMEQYYAQLEAGELPEEMFVYVSSASVKDPGNPHLAPPGHHNFQIMTLMPTQQELWGIEGDVTHGARYRREPQYRAGKERINDHLIDQAEKVLGPFRDRIVHLEAATPLTHQRYTLSTVGTSYGLQHSPSQIGPLRPDYRSPIDGLYLVGQNTQRGHGVVGTMMGALAAAGAVTGIDYDAELAAGHVLANPDLVPADPPGWDPLEVSRGERMRDLRSTRSQPRPA
ncbi:MAG: NAD(P)/FAD-dependent oxidoreductase [Microthrixaceae bacterium]|nr:NAD(P)/FAD-dependent oxidoreductase [Microthrixaceae bacterium]